MNTVDIRCEDPHPLKLHVEVTDTFGGDPNYAWVRRYELNVPEGSAGQSIVRAAKKAHGWTGLRCRSYGEGDVIEVKPAGMAQVMFITCEATR